VSEIEPELKKRKKAKCDIILTDESKAEFDILQKEGFDHTGTLNDFVNNAIHQAFESKKEDRLELSNKLCKAYFEIAPQDTIDRRIVAKRKGWIEGWKKEFDQIMPGTTIDQRYEKMEYLRKDMAFGNKSKK